MNKKIVIVLLVVLVLIAGAFAAAGMNKDDAQAVVQATAEPTAQPVDAAAQTEADAQAETPEDGGEVLVQELGGEILEMADGYIVIADSVNGQVQVNLGDDTLYDGADLEELAVGQYIQVMYDGKMTRSLPPQVYALKVGLYPVSGVVKEMGEGSVTLAREEIGDEVILFLPEGAPEMKAGDSVIAYTNGAMTMSIPAKTTAIGIVVQ